MGRIRIVNIITDTNIGGAGKVLQNYLAHYNREVFEVTVVLPAGSPLADLLEGYEARIISFEKLSGKSIDIGSIIPILRLLKILRPDIVHTHASLSSRIAARLYGKCKIIYTRHCVYPPSAFMTSGIGRMLGRTTAKLFSNRVIAISEATKENLMNTGVPESMISVMMNGVEPLTVLNDDEKTAVCEKYKINSGQKVAGMIGRLEPVKGHKYFIQGAKLCLDQGLDMMFIIAGSGGIEAELRQMTDNLNIADRVIFTGFLEDVAPVMNILDIFVNASYGTEASSLAMLEAMSLGKPVVATDYGGNPYQVKEGKTGFLVPIKDSDALAEVIVSILTDGNKYKQFSKNALADYNKNYTASNMTRIIEKMYMELINQ